MKKKGVYNLWIVWEKKALRTICILLCLICSLPHSASASGRIDELTADIQRIEQQQSAIAETLQRAVGAIERAEQHSASIAEGISELKDRAGNIQAGAAEGVGAAEKDGKLIEQGQRIIAEVQRRSEEAAAAAKS